MKQQKVYRLRGFVPGLYQGTGRAIDRKIIAYSQLQAYKKLSHIEKFNFKINVEDLEKLLKSTIKIIDIRDLEGNKISL